MAADARVGLATMQAGQQQVISTVLDMHSALTTQHRPHQQEHQANYTT